MKDRLHLKVLAKHEGEWEYVNLLVVLDEWHEAAAEWENCIATEDPAKNLIDEIHESHTGTQMMEQEVGSDWTIHEDKEPVARPADQSYWVVKAGR